MKFNTFIKKGMLAAIIAIMAAASPGTSQAAKGVLKMHEGDWTGNLVTCKLLEIILTDEMDYKVKRTFLPAGPVVYEAIIGGDLDFACEAWPSYNPTKGEYMKEWGGDGSVEKFGDVGVVGASGWYVPRYVIEGDAARGIKASAPDLKTYKQLNQYKDIFATPETAPKGRVLECPVAAWECESQGRVDGLGLDYVPVILGSDTAQWAELEGAYSRGEPILLYGWEPHWIHAKYDLVSIGLPAYSDDAWPATTWPEDITYNYGSPELKDKHADAYQLIVNQNLTNLQQSGMILDVDVNGVDLDAAVRTWMAANESVWRAWMP